MSPEEAKSFGIIDKVLAHPPSSDDTDSKETDSKKDSSSIEGTAS